MEILVHLIVLTFSAYIILSANPGSSLFSWHPTCMVLAWLLFTEGVVLFRKPRPGWRVNIHWAVSASGLTSAIYGFLAIYRNKEEAGKAHFESYHAIIGVITLALLTVQAIGGNFAKFSVPLSKTFKFIRPSLIKWGHRTSGSLALLFITVTLFLALFTLWFQAVTGASRLIWWGTASAICYPVFHIVKTAYF